MNLKEFKEEFRLMCDDTWGDALDAWFECVGHMFMRGLFIPFEWKYWHGSNAVYEQSWFHKFFKESSNAELIIIGNFLFRYCQYLKIKGKDY